MFIYLWIHVCSFELSFSERRVVSPWGNANIVQVCLFIVTAIKTLITQVQSKIVWNSMNSTIRRYAMSSEELPWLHNVFTSVGEDFDRQKTSYIFQFLWRDLTSRFDVIGPYFTCASSWDHKFLLECVMRTIQVSCYN